MTRVDAPLPRVVPCSLSPAGAWEELKRGHDRFETGKPRHPHQDAFRRGEIAAGQAPFASFFGCADSQLAGELIFDQGLGDLFVIRTAGHVVSTSVLGSLEFSTEVLKVPLIVVLGHGSCGVLRAAIRHDRDGTMPVGFLRDSIERVAPSVIAAKMRGLATDEEVECEHIRQTMRLLLQRSRAISAAVDTGRLGVIGLTYHWGQGEVQVVRSIGVVT